MKRLIFGTAAGLLAAVLFLTIPAEAASAQRAIVLDEVGKKVIYEKDAESRSLIASTTKIMTGLLVCENCNVLAPVRIPKEAVGIEGSSMYLREGEVLTIQELLYGMMLSSGNDAAVALAIACGGSVENFAEMMNEKARELGMTESHFENPNGLDGKQHYSTARDLGILGLEAMKNPIFAKTVSTKTVQVGNRYLKNHNKLLWRVPGADGVKTGYTRAAGRILVSSAARNGRRVVAVTINDPNDWQDHSALLENAFARYREKTLIREGERVGALEIAGGESHQVPILAARDFSWSVVPGEQPMVILPGPGFAYAPVVRGGFAGNAYVVLEGKVIGTIPVVYGRTVEIHQEPKKSIWERLFGGKQDGETAKNTVCPGGSLPAAGRRDDKSGESPVKR